MISVSSTVRLLRRLCSILLLTVLGFSVATAQIAPGETFVVRDIRVEGLQRISEGTVFNYLPVNIGDELGQRRIQEALLAVYNTGFFEDVELRRDGDVLIIAVLERPSIDQVTITGNKDIETEDLEESLSKIGLKTGRIFDQSVLDEIEQALTDQYFSGGKYAATVKTEVEELDGNRVNVAITIVEGERARIRQINIVGNTTYPDDDLVDLFTLKMPNWLSWIRQDDRYSREALSGDLETLRSYYMDRGFADYSNESTQVAISPDKKDIFITINIQEGDQYTISDVRLAGDLVVSEAELNPYVQVKPGQQYSQRLITQSAELIRLRLGEDGYAFATVEPVPELDREAKEVQLTLYVDPKNRVYVRRIKFNGAESVNDEVFRRELRQFEGGYLSNSKLERSKVRIQRLPYVENVDFSTNPVPGSPDLVDVDFEVEEGLPGQFGGGIGFSDAQGLLLNANLVHTNFLGTGNRVAANINTGRYRDIYSLSHTDPYATINGVSRTTTLAYRSYTAFTSDASDFETETISASLEYSYPISEFQRISLGGTWQKSELIADQFSTLQAQEWVLNNGDQSVSGSPGRLIFSTEFNTFELIAGWTFDSRNRALFADRGTRSRLLLSTTIPGSDVEYYTATYNFRQYYRPFDLATFSLNLDLGYGDALGDTTAIPPYRNWFAGGPDSVRGFKENDLGPKDSFGNPYGGNLLTAGQFEMLLPMPEKWRSRARFTLFFDAGNVFSTGGVTFFDKTGQPIDYDFDTSELRYSYGIAAQWLAPLGLFRFSYGFPLNEQDETATDYGDDVERFQFSIGGAF